MTKSEVMKFMGRVHGTYPNQFFLEDDVINEWTNRLEPYDKEDVERKFEEHLKGDMKERPPMIHFITAYLTRHEDKYKHDKEYQIACNLCKKWMSMSQYDSHYDRCLTIEYLLSVAKRNGKTIAREELEKRDQATIDKLYSKYEPQKIGFDKVIGVMKNGT